MITDRNTHSLTTQSLAVIVIGARVIAYRCGGTLRRCPAGGGRGRRRRRRRRKSEACVGRGPAHTPELGGRAKRPYLDMRNFETSNAPAADPTTFTRVCGGW